MARQFIIDEETGEKLYIRHNWAETFVLFGRLFMTAAVVCWVFGAVTAFTPLLIIGIACGVVSIVLNLLGVFY